MLYPFIGLSDTGLESRRKSLDLSSLLDSLTPRWDEGNAFLLRLMVSLLGNLPCSLPWGGRYMDIGSTASSAITFADFCYLAISIGFPNGWLAYGNTARERFSHGNGNRRS